MWENYGHHPGHEIKHHPRRGSLRIWVLAILQQSPRNGAEITDQIELASRGWWRPSPGSIYPLLDTLQKEGSVSRREDGRYEITEKGRNEYEWPCGTPSRQPRSVADIIAEMNSYISYLEDVKQTDASKIAPNTDKLKLLRDRLTAFLDSLNTTTETT